MARCRLSIRRIRLAAMVGPAWMAFSWSVCVQWPKADLLTCWALKGDPCTSGFFGQLSVGRQCYKCVGSLAIHAENLHATLAPPDYPRCPLLLTRTSLSPVEDQSKIESR